MIELDIEQGSDAWKLARLGIPTAACVARMHGRTGGADPG